MNCEIFVRDQIAIHVEMDVLIVLVVGFCIMLLIGISICLVAMERLRG